MGGMKVLLTNITLAERHGTVQYVRDLALGLLRAGHTPLVYAPELGEVAEELRAATIPVVDHLQGLPLAPDIIHGNCTMDTIAAMCRFPATPAVFACHAWNFFAHEPPVFPRLLRYIAVDQTCRDWLVWQRGTPPQRVVVEPNAVDLERFRPRPPLPTKPRRALVFSNYAAESNYLGAVRQACADLGIPLDVIGLGVGQPCARPEEILGKYDLVFAKARCALEAMAVGAAVILADFSGFGPLVTTSAWGPLRGQNFGRRALRQPSDPAWLRQEIQRYDAADAAAVTQLVRQECSLVQAVRRLLGLYHQILVDYSQSPAPDPVAELAAAGRFLDWYQGKNLFHGMQNRLQDMERKYGEAQAQIRQVQQSITLRLRNRLPRMPFVRRGLKFLVRWWRAVA